MGDSWWQRKKKDNNFCLLGKAFINPEMCLEERDRADRDKDLQCQAMVLGLRPPEVGSAAKPSDNLIMALQTELRCRELPACTELSVGSLASTCGHAASECV